MKSLKHKHGSKYFSQTSPPPPPPLPDPEEWGKKRSKFNFLEHGHVAFQIKWNANASTFFSESSHVAYHIRRECSIEHHASTYSVLTHTLDSWGGVKKKSESNHVAYQIKGNGAEHHASTYSVLTHTLNPWVGLKGQTK